MKKIKFKRVLLKLSGESLMGDKGFGIDHKVLEFFAEEVKKVHEQLSGDLQKLGTEAHKLEHEVHGTECHH